MKWWAGVVHCGIGLVLTLALLALAESWVYSSPAFAAPQAAPALAPARQVASDTATPRLVLTDTPVPGGTETTTEVPAGGPSATAGTPGAVATRQPGGSGGGEPGDATAKAQATATAQGFAPPALPGAAGSATAAPEGGGNNGAGPAPPGPAALIGPPVADRVIRQQWQRFGSPRSTQPVAVRLTADRPGPWGWTLFYVLLALAWAWALWRVWRAIGGLGGKG